MWKRKISVRINYSNIKKLASAKLIFFFSISVEREEGEKEGREEVKVGGKEGKGKEKGKGGRKERRVS